MRAHATIVDTHTYIRTLTLAQATARKNFIFFLNCTLTSSGRSIGDDDDDDDDAGERESEREKKE